MSSTQHVTETWQLRAACRGPAARFFFPPTRSERKDEKAEREERAKAICAEWSVRTDCLDYAVRIREPHVFAHHRREREAQPRIVGEVVVAQRQRVADRKSVV